MVLVIYRDDYRFLLDDVIPRQGQARADYDLVIASQPYRARVPRRVQGAEGDRAADARARPRRPAARHPLAAATTPASRSCSRCGRARTRSRPSRHDILRAVKRELGKDARHYNFNAYADNRARVPLRHAHAAERDRVVDRHLDAVRGMERRGLRGADRRRAAGRGDRRARATSTPRAKCCRSTAACGSRTSPT